MPLDYKKDPLKVKSTDLLHVELGDDADKLLLKVTGTADAYPSSAAIYFVDNYFHESKRLSDGRYAVPAADTSLQLIEMWGDDQVRWTDEAAVWREYLLHETQIERYNVELIAHHKNGEKPKVKPFKHNEDCALSEYQEIAATCTARSEGYALFMEQGTGKTPVAIAAICRQAEAWYKRKHYNDDGEQIPAPIFKVIVACPKNVRQNWINEFAHFSTIPYKATVLKGTHMVRVRTFIDAMLPDKKVMFSALIMSYETMVNTWEQLRTTKWDYAILDEAHYIKSPGAKRTKCAFDLRDASKQRAVLTGTPVTNTAIDLYTQFEFIRKGGSGFSSYKAFRNYYGAFIKRDSQTTLIGIQNLPFMQERLSRMAFLVDKETALPYLPKKMYDIFEVEMTAQQRNIYREVAVSLYAEIEKAMSSSDNMQMTINNSLTRLLRLAEITSGYVKSDDVLNDYGEVVTKGEICRIDPNPKLDGLVELLSERKKNSKFIVWACFQQDIRSIAARLRLEGLKVVTYYGKTSDKDREEAERAFNEDPDTDGLVGNPAAGGTGLNLLGYKPQHPEDYDTNADHIIYYSQNWSHPHRSQSEDRAHRRGTRVPVRITDLCIPGTIDEEIRARVTGKREHALQVKDIREMLKKVIEVNV